MSSDKHPARRAPFDPSDPGDRIAEATRQMVLEASLDAIDSGAKPVSGLAPKFFVLIGALTGAACNLLASAKPEVPRQKLRKQFQLAAGEYFDLAATIVDEAP